MSASKLVSEFITKFIESFDETSSKDDILKKLSSKEQKNKIKNFIDENKIKMKKKERDSSAPKKPESGYLLFCKDNRGKMKEKHPDMDNTEITKQLGKKWHSLVENKSDKVKNYLDKASELKAKYDEEMTEYKRANNLIKEEKPKNAFYYFKISKINELSESNPDKSKKELNKMIQTQWKELNSEKCETVKKFLEIAKEKKKDYNEKNNSVASSDDNVEVETKQKKVNKTKIEEKKKITRVVVDSESENESDEELEEEELDRSIEY
jgi:HMG (high mobility group) box